MILLNWKHKVFLLFFAGFIFGLALYFLAIKETVVRREIYLRELQTLETAKNLEFEINAIKNDIHKSRGGAMDGGHQFTTLPEFFLSLSDLMDVKVRTLPVDRIVHMDDQEVVYQTYQLSGTFTNLLLLLDSVEHCSDINLLTAGFTKSINPVLRSPELLLTLETVSKGNRQAHQ